jgi:hypothetical protein
MTIEPQKDDVLLLKSDDGEPVPQSFIDAFLSKEPMTITVEGRQSQALVKSLSADRKIVEVYLMSDWS